MQGKAGKVSDLLVLITMVGQADRLVRFPDPRNVFIATMRKLNPEMTVQPVSSATLRANPSLRSV
jgi:hypothetical protein